MRGFRIELGEIEAAMDSHADIEQSAVVVHQESEADTRLLGYYTAAGAHTESDFRAYLAARLPTHMVPSALIQLRDMPLTPNKKIDRNALIALAGESFSEASYTEEKPETLADIGIDVQSTIAAIWRSILGARNFAGSDNFFDVGGHSLLAVQAHREIREKLKVPKLSITDIFRFPVLKDLVTRVEELSFGAVEDKTPAAQAPTATDVRTKSEMRSNAMERRKAMRARRKS